MQKTLPIRTALLALALASAGGAALAQTSALFRGPCAASMPCQTRAWTNAGSAENALALQGGGTQTGEVVITEYMKDPNSVTDTHGEWFEIYNALPWRVNLEGWEISDSSGHHHVIANGGTGVRARPGHYLVFGNNGDMATNGGVHEDYVYTSITLLNGAGLIQIAKPGGAIVDSVAYDAVAPWPSIAGRACCLKLSARDAISNDNGANWCSASTPISPTNTDTGTPGADNDACP